MDMIAALQGQQGPAPTAAPSSNSSIGADFERFLKMLTVQMQNQNPLEPIEASDFAVQLATFAGVEQQVQTNQLLQSLTARMGLSELASWVGKDALSDAPVYVSGNMLRLVPPEVDGATRAELVVRRLNGDEVGRYPADPAASEIQFEIDEDARALLPDGYYRFEMVSYAGVREIATNPVLSYARIEEARTDAGLVLLVLRGGHIVNSADVKGLRAPE